METGNTLKRKERITNMTEAEIFTKNKGTYTTGIALKSKQKVTGPAETETTLKCKERIANMTKAEMFTKSKRTYTT